ncbi:hypothetical protein ASPVEDRAFT_32140 [Aspergillus versicolor CBS 583.65]|uniref:Zn(2)-C6 fungal-type domain-containing protein n=1 Tax=Aspergillus versicolor CBS 583.65 TaxID=1036611 RepID=A0A1L9PW52_ASPVE|nr:uncharacterized protein ASPVEDRAFT_32140 [Aspergillus versicolor CBS 583.65]OJJ05784.1 hypothetical protein ASPVEDRAFT_32140 [Aspergillus versicolor CBS 583.65]
MPPRHERAYNMHDLDNRNDAKRRKVRKGTRSCWECRRRKMKCIFAYDTDDICISCRRRGAKCVGQEFPEEVSEPLDRCLQMGDRLIRVESMLARLLNRVPSDTDIGMHSGNRNQDMLTGASVDLDGGRIQLPAHGKYGRLSQALYNALPSPEDTALIANASSDVSVLFYQMLTIPYHRLDQTNPKSARSLLERPAPDAHPVLIARHMLHLATSLQHIHPDLYHAISRLSEPPREMMKRLADIAIDLVTTKRDLTGMIEGLECMMIESLYLANSGNLRHALATIRRALTSAQLMGFHRPGSQPQYKVLDPKTEAHPQFIWFRIVSAERHLCLMLSLPQGTLDRSMASTAMLETDTAVGRIERLHCAIASRILERNQSDPSPADFALTQELDTELQRAAGSLPAKWWLTANPAAATDSPEALFWEVRRLFNQSFHYNLINQLHLPYMLRASSEHRYDYSRLMCVNSSREVLTRFTMFRGLDRIAFRCRTVDFFALMAAMTLLLAHIDEHRRCAVSLARLQHQEEIPRPENRLAHQRLSDRAMMEHAQESMEQVCRLTEDSLSAQSADLLRRLLTIEAEAAIGYSHRAEGLSVQPHLTEEIPDMETSADNSGGMCVHIPYFGVIKIAGNNVVSREIPEYPVGPDVSVQRAPVHFSSCALYTPAEPAPTLGLSNGLLSQGEYPLLNTEAGDSGFQGVDAAFFDSLMRGAGDGHDGTGWPVWPNEC